MTNLKTNFDVVRIALALLEAHEFGSVVEKRSVNTNWFVIRWDRWI